MYNFIWKGMGRIIILRVYYFYFRDLIVLCFSMGMISFVVFRILCFYFVFMVFKIFLVVEFNF